MKSAKMLIVDDDPKIRNSIRRIVANAIPHIKISDIGTSSDVISFIIAFKPHLILLDILMPKINGLELLSVLRRPENAGLQSIPIIMMTAVGNSEIITASKKLGAVDYILKPFEGEQLILMIRKYMGAW